MTSRTPMDAAFLETRDRGTEGLAMFSQIRIPAPAAPGSESSAEAAREIDGDAMQREMHKVLTWFAAQSEPRTRHECANVVYPYDGGLGPACGRINGLVALGCLEEVGRQGRRATLRITSAGRKKLARRAA